MRDAEIVGLLAAGDTRGLAAAYDAYADRIHDYAAWMLRSADPAAAADVVQDTFLIALAKAGSLRDPERLRSWLYAVARNECLRVLRAAGRSEALETDDGNPHPALTALEAGGSTDVSTGLSREDLRELVHAAAAGLSPKDREVFELGMRHDLAAAEIGKALGVADNAAHALLSRVRAQFARALGALVVARQGRGQCAELDGLLRGWGGDFDPLWRKRIARHVDGCEACAATQGRELSPAALLSVLPLAAAPVFLRDRLVGADPTELVAHAQSLAERAGPFDADGFPVPSEPYAADAEPGPGDPGPRGPSGGADGAAPTLVLPAAPPTVVTKEKRRRGLAVAAVLLLLLGGGTAWVVAADGSPDADTASELPLVVPSASPTPRSGDGAPAPDAGDELAPAPDAGSEPSPRPTPQAIPRPTQRPATDPQPEPIPRPTRSPSPTPVPAGTLSVTPTALTLVPGGSGTVRLSATGGPVDWTAVREGLAARRVTLSASSGSLAKGASTTVTITLRTSATSGSYVIVFGPGDRRVTVTVPTPG